MVVARSVIFISLILIFFSSFVLSEVEYIDESFLLNTLQNVTCKSALHTSSGAQKFFNGCLKDQTKLNFLGAIGAQIGEWFNQAVFLQYITSFLFFLPFVAFNEKRELATQAKANLLRCRLVLLLFRLGLATALATWFQALFQQSRPCECEVDGTGQYELIGSVWGMPSIDMMVTTILGLFFIQYLSKLLGLFLIVSVLFSRVVLGFDSVGQVVAAMIIGLILHIYQIGSPLFMRSIDYFANIFAGLTTFILVKRDFLTTDFSFAIEYLNGLAWMTFAVIVFFLYYDWGLTRQIINTPPHFINDNTFFVYTPIRDGSMGSMTISPQRKHETLFFIILTFLLFFTLVLCRVYAPFINQTLNAIWT